MFLQDQTWQQVKRMNVGSKIFIVPLGSLEQHGHHLPLSTDTSLVEGIARGLNEILGDDLVILPTLWCGHSTHHMAFPGTVSLSQSAYVEIICNICASLISSGARKIFLLNGHGGNDIPVRYAMRDLKSQYSDIDGLKVVFASYWSLAAKTLSEVRESGIGGLGHACEMETSMMLLLHNDLVDMQKAQHDGPKQIPPYRITDMQQGRPYYEVEEFNDLSESGTVGSPDLATTEKGQRFYNGIIQEVSAFVRDLQKW